LSELEDPVVTLLRLITTKIRVTKDNGSLASILATKEAYDRELLKERDAQITLGLDSSIDQKLELAGRLRRRFMVFRCNVYTVDKNVPGADAGKIMRDKVTEQINAIIRENRNLPYQTVYNFYGLGYPSGDPHKAFDAVANSELLPSSTVWIELSNENYQKLWSSDDIRHQKSTTVVGDYALMLFRFKTNTRANCLKKIVLSFEGYAVPPAPPYHNGVTIKVWNHVAGEWQLAQSVQTDVMTDVTLTITTSANFANFIDSNGYVWLLARTTNPSDGGIAGLRCDFVQCTIEVNGITFCDVISYRNIDVTDVKPYLFKTEFLLKAWLFESISGVF
jgi:hypothetical protein